MNIRGGAQTDTMVKLVLIFFISLLSFSVGTFVGKQFSDSQHKLASLEEDYGDGHRSTASVSEDDLGHAQAEGHPITEKEITDIAKEFVDNERDHMEASAYKGKTAKGDHKATTKEKHSDSHDTHQVAKSEMESQSQKKAHDKDSHSGVQKIAQILAHNEAPIKAPTKTETRQPSSLPQSVSSSVIGKYTVQVASYPSEKEADAHARQLTAKGWPAFYIPAVVNGKNWFRVSVGSFSGRQQAMDYRKQIMQQANLSTAIVQKVTN